MILLSTASIPGWKNGLGGKPLPEAQAGTKGMVKVARPSPEKPTQQPDLVFGVCPQSEHHQEWPKPRVPRPWHRPSGSSDLPSPRPTPLIEAARANFPTNSGFCYSEVNRVECPAKGGRAGEPPKIPSEL